MKITIVTYEGQCPVCSENQIIRKVVEEKEKVIDNIQYYCKKCNYCLDLKITSTENM